MGKTWIINSNPKDSNFKDKEKVESYIRCCIEDGEFIKISYIQKPMQEIIRNVVNGLGITEEEKRYLGKLNLKEMVESDKFLFVTENSYDEMRPTRPIEINYVDYDSEEPIKREDNWLDFGGEEVITKSVPVKKNTKKVVEKTRKFTFLISLIPIVYFLLSYNRRFSSVVTTSLIFSLVILAYLFYKKKADILNIGVGILFLSLWILKTITPYWANSIGSMYITMGFALIFVTGMLLDNSVINSYFGNHKNTKEKCEKFDFVWIVISAILTIYVTQRSYVSLGLILTLIGIPWAITAVNLKKAEYEEEIDDEEVKDIGEQKLEESEEVLLEIPNSEELDNQKKEFEESSDLESVVVEEGNDVPVEEK